jgi:hypothetical protein
LWLIFGAACVVLFCIRMLREPETAQRMDRLFVSPEQSADTPATINEVLAAEPGEVDMGPPAPSAPVDVSPPPKDNAENTQFDLSSVRDNTYFRPQENAAWFAVFDWLKQAKSELEADSLGEVSYAQFIDQPQVYRGKLVTVRGTIKREELLDAPANEIGIKRYHRLILRPAGGSVWPIVVYCLELPANFPRGSTTNAEVDVKGVFFKNWSYSWQGGLGLAPVVLAQTVDWYPMVAIKRPRANISAQGLIAATAAAGVIATFVGWFVWRHTRRAVDVLDAQRVIIAPPSEES